MNAVLSLHVKLPCCDISLPCDYKCPYLMLAPRPIEGSMWRLSHLLLLSAGAVVVAVVGVTNAAAPDFGPAPLTSVAAAGRYYRPLTLNKLKELILENIEERSLK